MLGNTTKTNTGKIEQIQIFITNQKFNTYHYYSLLQLIKNLILGNTLATRDLFQKKILKTQYDVESHANQLCLNFSSDISATTILVIPFDAP